MNRTIAFLVVLASLVTGGCQTETDEYFVKYSINSDHYQIGHKLNLTLNDVDNELNLIIDVNELVETTIGPVPYGFNASMLAEDDGGGDTYELYAEILVSKNGGPFTTKAIDGSEDDRSSVSLDYTIDF